MLRVSKYLLSATLAVFLALMVSGAAIAQTDTSSETSEPVQIAFGAYVLRIQVAKTAFDLSALVRQLAERHVARARLVINCPSPQMVVSDAGLLKLIVENLIDNAAKYSKSGAEIQLALTCHVADGQEDVRLSITNEIGQAGPPDPERLFTKYYRAKGAHRQPGSGLGLFLVASWVNALGGSVTYTQENLPNGAQQAIFTVSAPK